MTGLYVALGVIAVIVILGALLVSASKRRVEQLRARAAAGDPAAKKELQRLDSMQRALERSQGKADHDAERIVVSGVHGRATVNAVRRAGFSIKRGGEKLSSIDVDFTCDVEGKPPFEATVNDMIAEPLIGRLLIGATVPIVVDREPPNRVVVLWDRV